MNKKDEKKASGGFMSVADAREFINSRVSPIDGAEKIPLRESLGRICARDVLSPIAVPGHDNSAMDGFAARVEDLSEEQETPLMVVGESFAGHFFDGEIKSGECVRIMTGAMIPVGADIIIPREETKGGGVGDVLISPAKRSPRQHFRFAGEDLRSGAIAVAKGTLLRPAEIGLLASLGLEEVEVKPKLRVAFFSTGDEVRPLGESLRPGEVYDSNRHTLFGMISRMGFDAIDLGVIGDDPSALEVALDSAAEAADAIITSGGVSVGDADFVRDILARRGEVLFWKVAMKPGRPLAYGKVGGADFFGLPGNPVSVMVTFYQFVREALWRRAGRIGNFTLPAFEVACATPLKKSAGRAEYQRGILNQDDDGKWQVAATGAQGSGILTSMSRANCFIVLAENRGDVQVGEKVKVEIFEGIV